MKQRRAEIDLSAVLDPFGDGSGIMLLRMENNVLDESGNYDGVANNISYAPSALGGVAAVFNGSAKITTSLTVPDVFSISLWFSYTATNVQGRLVNFATSAGPCGFCKESTTNSLNFQVGTSVYKGVLQSAYSDDNLHHMVGTSDGRLYIDNVEITTPHTYIGISDSTFTIGTRSGIDQFFNGNMDQLRVFNKDLSVAETNTLYQAGA